MADWQTLARRAAQQEHVDPNLFLGLVRQESGGRADARSGAGALGYTQLMPATAKSLGVNPNDPWQNLVGGARYLSQQLKAFGGDPRKALAAYNAGPGAVQKYGGVPPFAETQNYVKSILGSLGTGAPSSSGGTSAEPAQDAAPAISTRALPQGADATALLALLGQQREQPRPVSSTPLPTPAATAGPAMPDAYHALASGSGPAKKGPDVGALLAQLQASVASNASAGTPAAAAGPVTASAASTQGPGQGGGVSPHAKPGDPVVSSKQSVGGEHATDGLAGYPAHDYFAPAGSHAVAPVSGTVIKLSGHDPKDGPTNGPHGPLGWSAYIKGDDGRTYFLTHMGSRNLKVGQAVKQGQVIGSVADYDKYGTPSHIHMGVSG